MKATGIYRFLTAALLVLALLIIALMTLTPTPGSITAGQPQWCLGCGRVWLADGISNVTLFIPLGAALVLRGRTVLKALVIGALLSLTVESLQAVGAPLGRTPALADWLTNSAGTFIGAWTVANAKWLLSPNTTTARVLLFFWTTGVVAVLSATSWALSASDHLGQADSAVQASALPFTPGYGWFAAVVDSAIVNQHPISHRGTGPIIVTMERTDTVHVRAFVRGRDSRRSIVPIVYVHAPGHQAAHTLVGQLGTSAVLRTGLNARRLGLVTPLLVLHNAFGGLNHSVSNDVASLDSQPAIQLDAEIHRGLLKLSARTANIDTVLSATLAITPALGWTLLQSVVRVDFAIGSTATALWLFLWFFPAGMWCARSATRQRTTRRAWLPIVIAGVWLGVVTAIDAVVSRHFAIQPMTLTQLAVSAASVAIGAAIGANRKPGCGVS